MALSYSDNFDAIVALATHLGSTPRKSRRAPSLSRDLGFPIDAIRAVLDGFPGIFRKSRTTDSGGEHYYTLQLRYARRPFDEEQNREDVPSQHLQPEELSTLLDLILKMVAHERQTAQLSIEHQYQMSQLSAELKQRDEESKQRDRALRLTIIVTLVVAIIGATATIWKSAEKSNAPAPSTSSQSSAPASSR